MESTFIDIKRLLSGETVAFSLPRNNTKWLIDNGWYFDQEDASKAVFINQMNVFAPTFSKDASCHYAIETVVETTGLTSLNVNHGATYALPSTQYRLRYEKATDSCRGDDVLKNPTDDKATVCINSYGTLSSGEGQVSTPPSLFSSFRVRLHKKLPKTGCKQMSDKDLEAIKEVTLSLKLSSVKSTTDYCWPNPCKSGEKCQNAKTTFKCSK